jgi:endoglucanase
MSGIRKAAQPRRVRLPLVAGVTLTLLAQGVAGGAAFAASTGHDSTPATAHRSPMAAVAAMQPSWNLGNTLDAIPTETSWGNPLVTRKLFTTIRAQGFRSVRIPVTWDGHQSSTAPYTIDPVWMSRVKQVVDWAVEAGLSVDLNVHHDSWQWIAGMPSDHDGVLARFDATWTQIADSFANEPDTVLFESVNEPQFTNATPARTTELLNELNTSFHDIIRATGGRNSTRLLVLPTLGCTPSLPLMNDLSAEMASLHDSNLVATVHYYGYWPFSANIAGATTFDTTSQQDMDTAFAGMRDTFVAKGIPVYLGEYGLLSYPDYTKPYNNVEPGEALKYFERFGYDARANGVTTALWDAGSFLNRNTFAWRDAALTDRIRSSWSTRSATASSDQVFVPASGTITDQALTLDTNGASLRGLWRGNSRLVPGRDYTLSGDRLTLTAAELNRLTTGHTYGVNATLEARFSAGVPWHIDVLSSDTPTLADAAGTTDTAFGIPTDFRGDVPATMEARYADGSNAGPADWTPFQEFGSSFAPDFAGHALDLTPGFLTSLKDGVPATLTFHFWSGATVTYHVTRTGTAVSGSAS